MTVKQHKNANIANFAYYEKTRMWPEPGKILWHWTESTLNGFGITTDKGNWMFFFCFIIRGFFSVRNFLVTFFSSSTHTCCCIRNTNYKICVINFYSWNFSCALKQTEHYFKKLYFFPFASMKHLACYLVSNLITLEASNSSIRK